MSIIFRGKDQDKNEAEYVEKFANPFPAAVRGKCSMLSPGNGNDKVVIPSSEKY